jgi:hypothetical protein
MGDAASTFFVRQHACKASFVSFVQFLFGLLAVWVQVTTLADTVMNFSFVSFSHGACPDIQFFKTRVSYFKLIN